MALLWANLGLNSFPGAWRLDRLVHPGRDGLFLTVNPPSLNDTGTRYHRSGSQ